MDERLKKIIDESSNIVFFGGAGVSTESGVPDFRSESGLYHAKQKYGHSPETMLSYTFYVNHPEARPNAAHRALAKLEEMGKLRAVITQNIDGLHQKAGSRTVYEVHGSVLRNYCESCHKFYDVNYIMDESHCKDGVPYCTCGGRIKPDVVLYEEALDQRVLGAAVDAIERADCMIVGGTSLVVYPAAGLINYFHGKHLVLINKSATPYDSKADLVINDAIGKVMSME